MAEHNYSRLDELLAHIRAPRKGKRPAPGVVRPHVVRATRQRIADEFYDRKNVSSTTRTIMKTRGGFGALIAKHMMGD